MLFLRKYQRFICALLAMSVLSLGINKMAVAAIVTTEDIVAAKALDMQRDQIRDWLSRDEVRQMLVDRGVNPDEARDRVDSMTDIEVQTVAAKIDDLPAGGDALGVLLIIFLVLVITDLLGITDIFTFIKKR